MKITENYVFFWGGIFSNFSKTPIILENFIMVDELGQEKDIVLSTSEHYFHYLKALKFNDIDSAVKILEAPTPREAKKLGRKVSGFDEKIWNEEKTEIMLQVLREKFNQNETAKDELLNSIYFGKKFVEASPYDKIWGIGMSEDNPELLNTSLWGQNLLGECLNKIRLEILLEKWGCIIDKQLDKYNGDKSIKPSKELLSYLYNICSDFLLEGIDNECECYSIYVLINNVKVYVSVFSDSDDNGKYMASITNGSTLRKVISHNNLEKLINNIIELCA